MVRLVLEHYPVGSIREIRPSLSAIFAGGPWKEPLVRIEGEELSLDDIEHRILRPIWRDPRIHYALNCAAKGCPALLPEAFTAENTERLLEAGARAYVNGPHGVRFDGDRLVVSSLYRWYAADLGGTEAAVLEHLRAYAAPWLRERLAGRHHIDAYAYDWSLNDAEDR